MAKSFVDILIRAKDVTGQAVVKANKSLGKLSTTSEKLNSTFSTLKKHWLAISASMIAVAVPLRKVVGSFKDFETALVDMGKVTDESLTAIKQRIMELPPEIGSATEMMQGYYQVISAGVTEPKKALETLIVASKAAKASHTAQSEVIKGLTKMMAGFEGEIKDVTEASDLLFTIEKEGQTTFQEMIPVIGGLAKMSRDLSVSSDEMGASLATITQTAGSTAEAATQYRAILVALSKSQEVARVTTEELGYSGIQAAIEQEGLAGVLEKLRDRVGGSAEAMSKLLGRQEAMLGVSALGAKNFETVNQKLAVMKDKTGATDRAFAAWEKTLAGLWSTFKNTIGRIAIEIGAEIAPALKELMEGFGKESQGIVKNFSAVIKILTATFSGLIKVIVFTVKHLDSLMVGLIALAALNAPAMLASIAAGFKALTASIVTANTALKRFLPILVGIASYEIFKWVNKLEVAGSTVASWAEQFMLHLFKLNNTLGIATLKFRKFVTEVVTLTLADTSGIDKQIAALERHGEALDGAIEMARQEKYTVQKAAEALKKHTESLTDDAKAAKASADETDAANKKKQISYEDFIFSLEKGSKEYVAIKNKELATLKASVDYEIALEEQRYSEGKISLEAFLNFRKQKQEQYVREMIALKEMELESLKQSPDEERFEKIKAVEENIKQLKLQSMQEQLKFQQDLAQGLKEEYDSDFNNWQAVQDRRLEALKNRFDLENTIEEAAAEQGLIRQSELLEGKLQRLREYYQMQINIANETLLRIAEISGMESAEYQKMFRGRERLQTELQIKIIESEANIKEVRMNEEREAQKFIAELTDEREDLAEIEAEEKLKILRKYHEQALISEQQYTDAVAVIEEELTEKIREHTEKRTEIMKGWVIVTQDTMDRVKQTLEEALDVDLEGVYSRVTRFGRYLQNLFFPEFRDAIKQAVAEIKDIAGTLPGYLMDLAKQVGMAVSATVFEYAQQVAEYLNYVKGLLLELQGLISSYRKQLLQLRGDRIALIEMWYEEELAKLREKFKDLENTAEYKEAMKLIQVLYKEKLEMAKEAMEQEEDLWDNLSEKIASSAGKIKNAIKDSIPSLTAGEFQLGASQEITITKDIKLDSFFQIQTFDSAVTVRWLKDIVFPEWEKHLKLKGIKL